jgi:hypothetical protein
MTEQFEVLRPGASVQRLAQTISDFAVRCAG